MWQSNFIWIWSTRLLHFQRCIYLYNERDYASIKYNRIETKLHCYHCKDQTLEEVLLRQLLRNWRWIQTVYVKGNIARKLCCWSKIESISGKYCVTQLQRTSCSELKRRRNIIQAKPKLSHKKYSMFKTLPQPYYVSPIDRISFSKANA